jgi:hypothetical protein
MQREGRNRIISQIECENSDTLWKLLNVVNFCFVKKNGRTSPHRQDPRRTFVPFWEADG